MPPGPAGEEGSVQIETLAEILIEPLWIFYRSERFTEAPSRFQDLTEAQVAIGGTGSGTRKLSERLVSLTGLSLEEVAWQDLGGADAVAALVEGEIDAAFLVSDASSVNVQTLLRTEGLRLMSLDRAEGIAQQAADLQRVVLAAGAIDLANDQPSEPVEMVAPVASLVARADLHPAVTALVLEVARSNHGRAGLFAATGAFPRANGASFPVNAEAARYLNDGPPFLQRYLPFWLAVLVDRMVVLLIPFVAVLLPLFRFFPPLYSWRMQARVYRWYRDVARLETEIRLVDTAEERAQGLLALDRLEADVARLDVPLGYAHSVYQLRQHIRLVRDQLAETLTPERSETSA